MDPRLAVLRAAFLRAADRKQAEFNRAYHKSPLRFHGVRTPAWRAIVREVFPTRPKIGAEEAKRLAAFLWESDWMEERSTALELLSRVATDLTATDAPLLRRMTHGCFGWGLLDSLSIGVLGPLAMERGDPVYQRVRTWSEDRDLWTRRASVLVHVFPARRGRLAHGWAWDTFEELLPETDFFLRKAIGWALRECCRHYSARVHAFLLRVGDRASGLTRREGSRLLPARLRASL